LLKIDFFWIIVSDVTVTVGCSAGMCWAAVRADAAIEVGGGEAALQTDWTRGLNRPLILILRTMFVVL